jgi:hypothetical protein
MFAAASKHIIQERDPGGSRLLLSAGHNYLFRFFLLVVLLTDPYRTSSISLGAHSLIPDEKKSIIDPGAM